MPNHGKTAAARPPGTASPRFPKATRKSCADCPPAGGGKRVRIQTAGLQLRKKGGNSKTTFTVSVRATIILRINATAILNGTLASTPAERNQKQNQFRSRKKTHLSKHQHSKRFSRCREHGSEETPKT